jgi:hypothetical protein
MKRLHGPRPLYLAALVAGLTLGAVLAASPPSLAGCPPSGEGRGFCVLETIWLRGLTICAIGLMAGHIVGDVVAYRLPGLVRRLRGGERLRFRLPYATLPATLATDPRTAAASWAQATTAGRPARAAEVGWLLGRHRVPVPPGTPASPAGPEPALLPAQRQGAGSAGRFRRVAPQELAACVGCGQGLAGQRAGDACASCGVPILPYRRITGDRQVQELPADPVAASPT